MITAPVNYPVPYRLLPLFLHSSPINTLRQTLISVYGVMLQSEMPRLA